MPAERGTAGFTGAQRSHRPTDDRKLRPRRMSSWPCNLLPIAREQTLMLTSSAPFLAALRCREGQETEVLR